MTDRPDALARAARPEAPPDSTLAWRPGLDGLRALAVTAVFAYHARLTWASGGFLGVDVFFVVSGFLITALLLDDHARHGHIRLGHFWGRRARRLLPALGVLLVGVTVVVPLLAPDQLRRLPGDLAAAAGYVSNWRLILEDLSYFEAAGRPPLFQHLWSLAVEEQFYLVWPVVLAAGLRARRAPRLAVPLLVAALGSAALMAALYEPYADPSRVYYGTDTRLAALLVGAALGCVTWRWMSRSGAAPGGRPGARHAWGVAGLAALAALGWCAVNVDEFDPALYRGGFLAVAFLAAVVVAAAAHPRSWFGAVLGAAPLVWLGRRSYAVYLWFWPVMMLTRPHLDVPLDGLPSLALRAGLTLALADASYRFVEQPVRRKALARRSRPSLSGRPRARVRMRARVRVAAAGAAIGVASAVVVGAALGAGPSHDGVIGVGVTGRLQPVELSPAAVGDGVLPAGPPSTTVPTATTVLPTTTVPPTTVPPTTVPPTTVPPPPPPPALADVWAVGDSVMAGARAALEAGAISVDAAIGRQYDDTIAAVASLRDTGAIGDAVVVHIGNNGPIGDEHVDRIVEAVPPPARVVLVTVKVDRAWERHNNEVLAHGVERWGERTLLADWHAVGVDRPDAFYGDGLHLTPTGSQLFTECILRAIGR